MSEEKLTREELIKKAEKPGRDAMILHPYYRGKVQVTAKCVVRNMDDFAIWYTPGVAKPCLAIKEDPLAVFEHTNKG
ncbi:MAG TPA: malate dehydrogenase, partial [candidate division Zixibacteria bacterium]|nr:malate dehydrogenase [candidate division Zixibacteria bacterium]